MGVRGCSPDIKFIFMLFRDSLDFLDIRLTSNSDWLKNLYGLVENSHIMLLDFWFYVSFQYQTESRKVLWIKDKFNVEIIYISLYIWDSKKNSEGSYCQFVWHFFTLHFDYLDYFLNLFWIDKNAPDRVRRFDYCFDCYSSPSDLDNFRFSTNWKITKFHDNDYFSWLKIVVWDSKDTKSHEISLYDKKLDTLLKRKYQYNIPDNPYKKLLDTKSHITRLECRFFNRSLRRLLSNWKKNNSLNRIINDSRTLAFQYLSKWYNLPFDNDSSFVRTSSKPDNNFKKISEQKLHLYKSQASAYMENIRDLESEKELFDFIRKSFPAIDDYILWSIITKWSKNLHSSPYW